MPTKCEILTEVHYMERVHPRNCRKDRVRENIFLANAVFEAFTEDEAPVALIVKYYDLQRGARAVNHLVKAMDELKSFNKAEWLNASLCANETEGFLRKYLCGIVYRRQRGTDMLTEEQLNAATEQAYNDLLNRTRIDRY